MLIVFFHTLGVPKPRSVDQADVSVVRWEYVRFNRLGGRRAHLLFFVVIFAHCYGFHFSICVVDCDLCWYNDNDFLIFGLVEGFAVHVVGEGVDECGFAYASFAKQKDVNGVGVIFRVKMGDAVTKSLLNN